MSTAKSVIDKAAILLTDAGNVRWSRAELLGWMNDARRQIVLFKPSSHNAVVDVKLKAGTHQQIPTDGYMLLGISHNMGTDGLTPGPAIRIISREVLDSYLPTWHQAPAEAIVQNYVFSMQDQTAFYVYPPSNGQNFVKLNYSRYPVNIVSESEQLGVHEILEGAVLDYMMYRAVGKDAEYAAMQALSQRYYDSFKETMIGKEAGEAENNPNLGLFPANEPKVS